MGFIGHRAVAPISSLVIALGLTVLTFSAAGSRPEETDLEKGGAVSIELTKTVGTDPAVCAPTDNIMVTANRTVVYCYNVENTGDMNLSLHTLEDDQLGTLLADFFRTLTPGSSFFVTETAQIAETTVNTATWTATNGLQTAVDSDTATVTIAEPSIELTKTVGTEPEPACATEDFISVPPGTDVTYCYEVRNTGNTTFSLHDLFDDQLGLLQDDLLQELAPGQTLQVTTTANILTTTVNSATWTARDPFFAQAMDTATVDTSKIFDDGFENGTTNAWQ